MTSATTFSTSVEAQQAAALLDSYRFELGDHDARQWVSLWLEFYRPSWIRDAVVEALYQGRYKSVSVRQILEMWQRRAKPIRHVTHEFEAAVCRELGEVKTAPSAMAALPHVQRRNRFLRNRSSARQISPPPSSARQSPEQPSPTRQAPARQAPANPSPTRQASANPSPARQASANPSPARQASARQILSLQSSQHPSSNPEATRPSTYSSAPTVSFNLSKRSPPLAADTLTNQPIDRSQSEAAQPKVTQSKLPSHRIPAQASNLTNTNFTNQRKPQKPKATSGIDSGRRLDNTAWREFPNYTTPTHALPDLDETLRLQRQFKENLNESERAIQPFKPALPFSAKTLRLAKQQTSNGTGL